MNAMVGKLAPPLLFTALQRKLLEQITRCRSLAHHYVLRACIILDGTGRDSYRRIAARHHLHWQTVRLWQQRWHSAYAQFAALENEVDEQTLLLKILAHLSDAPRSGAPPQFSAEQICQIIAVSCEKPRDCGHEISH